MQRRSRPAYSSRWKPVISVDTFCGTTPLNPKPKTPQSKRHPNRLRVLPLEQVGCFVSKHLNAGEGEDANLGFGGFESSSKAGEFR